MSIFLSGQSEIVNLKQKIENCQIKSKLFIIHLTVRPLIFFSVELLAWIATVLILISKACGTGMNSKGFAGCMYKSTWVFVVNAVLFLFFLISACILATNAKRFDLGSVRNSVF